MAGGGAARAQAGEAGGWTGGTAASAVGRSRRARPHDSGPRARGPQRVSGGGGPANGGAAVFPARWRRTRRVSASMSIAGVWRFGFAAYLERSEAEASWRR